MKALLGILLCFLFATAECLAVKGGPEYPLGNNIVGTYAGVLQGAFDPTNPGSSNTIGIFSLGLPQSGTASGGFLMFSRGRVFTGTIQAFGDPQKGSLKGILDATYNFSYSIPVPGENGSVDFETINVTATANGPISANIVNTRSRSSAGGSVTRVRGEATLHISQGTLQENLDPFIDRILSLVVSGIKQSDTVTVTAGAGTGG